MGRFAFADGSLKTDKRRVVLAFAFAQAHQSIFRLPLPDGCYAKGSLKNYLLGARQNAAFAIRACGRNNAFVFQGLHQIGGAVVANAQLALQR